jgi:DNA anti-recombination protein RmuC
MSALQTLQHTVTRPLRVVQNAVTPQTQQLAEQALAPVQRRLDQLEQNLDQRVRAAVKDATRPLTKKLTKVDGELTAVRKGLDQIRDDVAHIRTEQAAEAAEGKT